MFILLVLAAPILGAITPQVSAQNEYGLGVNLQTVQPQLQQVFSSASSQSGLSSVLTVPAFNNWFLSGSVTLSLSLGVNGTTLYQSPKATESLAPFHSGVVSLPIDIPASTLQQMSGQQISGGGQMTIQEAGLWTITVNLGQG